MNYIIFTGENHYLKLCILTSGVAVVLLCKTGYTWAQDKITQHDEKLKQEKKDRKAIRRENKRK